MAKTLVSNTAPTHDEISARAYEIYLREGCVAGRNLEHWLQAEAELRNSSNGDRNGHSPEIAQAPGGNADAAKIVAPPATAAVTAPRPNQTRRTAKR